MRDNDPLSRRQLLKFGSGASLLAILSQQVASSQNRVLDSDTDKGLGKKSVIVVGAGVSGLAAAQILRLNGFDVIVLEARDRIGGRIFTDRESLGIPIELGASWIHGITGNPLYKLTQTNGIKTIDCDYESMPQIFQRDGQELDAASVTDLKAAFSKIRKRLSNMQRASMKEDRSLSSAIWQVIPGLKLSARNAELIKHVISTDIENDYATNAEHLSLQSFEEDESFTGGDYLVPNGYSAIVDLLARALDIRLSKVVKAIDYSGDRVKIVCASGEQFAGDFAVSTLPLGVLKQRVVAFSPDLPMSKLQAIEGLGMGFFDKVYLRFKERFWSNEYSWIEYAGEEPDQWPMFFNLARFCDKPVLVAFNVGRFAEQLEHKSEEEVVSECLAILRKMYGAKVQTPLATKCTSWGRDPFSLGSYSYVPVGASTAHYDALGAAVEEKLFFAGEACNSKHYSSADAAYLTGEKAARQIIKVAARLRR